MDLFKDEDKLKELLKQAVSEVFKGERDLFSELVKDALTEMAFLQSPEMPPSQDTVYEPKDAPLPTSSLPKKSSSDSERSRDTPDEEESQDSPLSAHLLGQEWDKIYQETQNSPVEDISGSSEEETWPDDTPFPEEVALAGNGPEVVEFLDELLLQGRQKGAGQIHLDRSGGQISLRFRIDGDLISGPSLSHQLFTPLVSRLVLLAQLDLAPSLLPQWGYFQRRQERYELYLAPGLNRSSAVIHLLPSHGQVASLEEIAFPTDHNLWSSLQKHRRGLYLLASPHRTTRRAALYSLFSSLEDPQRNSVAVDSREEWSLPRIRRVSPPQDKGDLTDFLQQMWGQDGDTFLVENLDGKEWVQWAIGAAQGGKVVLAGVQAGWGRDGLTRLVESTDQVWQLAAQLRGVATWHRLWKNCPQCREEISLSEEEERALHREGEDLQPYYRSRGCEQCRHTGYHGHLHLWEVIEMDREKGDLIRRGDVSHLRSQLDPASILSQTTKWLKSGDLSPDQVLALRDWM